MFFSATMFMALEETIALLQVCILFIVNLSLSRDIKSHVQFLCRSSKWRFSSLLRFAFFYFPPAFQSMQIPPLTARTKTSEERGFFLSEREATTIRSNVPSSKP